jgi:Ni,Fe-hydrogenase I large subunit
MGEGQGLAWVEMARGLLVHRVAVNHTQGPAKVVACDVIAPTEWNFHPHGVVAQYATGLDVGEPADMTEHRVRLLMAAFDPCVPFEVLAHPSTQTETSHA